MLRCLVYRSLAEPVVAEPSVLEMLDRARAFNAAAGITGRLIFAHGCFVQVLEGPGDVVGGLYERILHDPRHRDVRIVSDRPVAEREFANWSMEYASEAGLNAAESFRLADVLERGSRGAAKQTADRELSNMVLRSPAQRPYAAPRAVPKQSRAQATVERLIAAAAAIAQHEGMAALTVGRAARAANLTVPAAYRYFASSRDLVAELANRAEARCLDRWTAALRRQTFDDAAELAETLATTVCCDPEFVSGIAMAALLQFPLDRHGLSDNTVVALTASVRDALRRSGLPCHHTINDRELAAILGGFAGTVRSMALTDAGMLQQDTFRHMLAGQLLGALRRYRVRLLVTAA